MRISTGESVFEIEVVPCFGTGLRWSEKELDAAIDDPVASVLFDDEGRINLEDILSGLAETNFAQEGVRRVLEDPDEVEDWRVGEAIAEAYLTEHRSCHFPWPDGRDERKRRSSLPGADLVGFGTDTDGDCLAFGEVKTSSERRYPPTTMYGRTGLKQQLEDLRDRPCIRDQLLRYLGHRATGAPWRKRFENAGRRYLRNNADVQLFGFLVRDVEPNQDDLRIRVGALATGCPEGTRIELLALYLPRDSIDGIGGRTVTRRTGAQP